MSRVGAHGSVDQWARLELYRQRYQIEDRVRQVDSLERSMNRRRERFAALNRRLEDLERQLAEVRAEIQVVDTEIEGSRTAGALLIEELVDQVRIEMGEAWSPTPVRGYRVWHIRDGVVRGNQLHWPSPTLASRCLREIPGEDLPHSVARCGPPACGIYAVKDLAMCPSDIVDGEVDRSVVGVVAMSGKVIEHELGYRGQFATVVALSTACDGAWLRTSEPDVIEAFFDHPEATVSGGGRQQAHLRPREFLGSVIDEEEKWI